MNDPGTEQLSRLIDGDLGAGEAEELTEILASDRGLRRELEGLKRVRSSLMSLAARERPPEQLDALVDPLLRGKPETASGRPWVRRLAAAAVVVLGVSVIIEVQRRQPDPAALNWQERAQKGAAAEPTERFSLAPLPTSSVPADEQQSGAADRLLAAPEPEVEPVLTAAPALEVMGPLDTAAKGDAAGPARDDLEAEPPARHKSLADGERRAGGRQTAEGTVRGGPTDAGPPPAQTRQSSGRSAAEESAAPAAGGQLFVFMEAETAWRSFDPEGQCEAGRYALRVRIENGIVREVWPVANPPAPARQVRASQLVLGLAIDNVADGEYSAEVVVEPRRPPGR